MKAVIFVIVILGIIIGYAMIDEMAKNGSFSSFFGWGNRVESQSSSSRTSYYSSTTQSNSKTESNSSSAKEPSSTPNYIGKVKIYSINKWINVNCIRDIIP